MPAALTLGLSLVWQLVWSSVPEGNSYVPASELAMIQRSRRNLDRPAEGGVAEYAYRPTRRQAFASPVFFGSVVVSLVNCFGFYTLLTFLPQYMEYQLDCSLKGSGGLSVLPYVSLGVLKVGSGELADRMIGRWGCSLPFTRKLLTAIATFGTGAALACVPLASSPAAAIALFAGAMGACGFQISGSDLALSDLFAEHFGLVYGVMNGVGSLAGAAAPLVIGLLTSKAGCVENSNHPHETERCDQAWYTVFYLSAGLYVGAGLIFTLVGSCDPGYAVLTRERAAAKRLKPTAGGSEDAGPEARALLVQ